MPIEWSPELAVNDAMLDEHHVDLFRKLADASAALDGKPEALEGALSSFGEALMAHLAEEERFMDETLYPERVRHRSAHELFVADFLQMRAELAEKGPTPQIVDWIRRRIPEWLRFHIRVNDAPLGEYLARRRQQQPGLRRARRNDGRRPS